MTLRRSARSLLGGVRVALYLSGVSLVVLAAASRVALARIGDGVVRVGDELDQVADMLGDPKTIFLNGAAIRVTTAFTTQSPREVLDRYEAICRAHPQLLARAMDDVPGALKAEVDKKGLVAGVNWQRVLDVGIARKDTADAGGLACMMDERPATLRDVTARIEKFQSEGDLSELGRFRYVRVKATAGGTHVRTVWADGPVPTLKMFPRTGDAAGFDSEIVPRPPNARRLISATSTQVPFSVHTYESTDSEKALRAFYDAEMTARGWKPLVVRNTTVYEKVGGEAVYFSFSQRGGHGVVTATATGRQDTPVLTVVRGDPFVDP
jgi:hypothetical protein